jgi:manganese oxidase
MYHCHVQYHADGGMVGVFLVTNEDGSVPGSAKAALDRFQSGPMGHMGGMDHP